MPLRYEVQYNGSDIDDIITKYGDGTDLIIDATQFAAFSYSIDQNVTNNITKKGTFKFNITDVCNGTGEGTYNINTKEGTITNTDLLGAISNFTATYDKITNKLDISIADPNQLMYYLYAEPELGEGIPENNTVTEEIEENIAQGEPYSIVNVNATLDGLIQQA